MVLSDLAAGLYSFIITDQAGTVEELDIEVSIVSFMPDVQLEASWNCETEAFDIETIIESGFNNLSFEWSNGAFTKNLEGVEGGSYELTITNEFGCTKVASVEIPEQGFALDYEIQYHCERNQFTIQLLPSLGGYEDNRFELMQPTGITLNVSRNTFSLGSPITDLFFGTYNAKVINADGCIAKATIEVTREDYLAACGRDIVEEDCAIMQVDIATPKLRRCFEDNLYTVTYANYGALTAEDAYVEVQLDPFLTYLNSSIAAINLGDNLYRFDLGNVASGADGRFKIEVEVSCEAVLGQTHCTQARIFPSTPCDVSNLWSGAEVSVEARCDDETVLLRLRNTGTEDMDEPLSYITIEDIVMLNTGNFQLPSGAVKDIRLPKNGSTYRLQAKQVANYPRFSQPSIAIEGCGTNEEGTFSTGYITQFPQDEKDRSTGIDCQENIGSYDPNDKLATPTGVGNDQLIAQNTDIEYRIRFQNTGTDTAFTVVILDTLSTYLDTASIQLGASSHPYTYELLSGNVMQFRFDSIMLPDSATNLIASEGFVQFRISQLANLPDGIRLENTAAIYFDFNDPIITNTVWHNIGRSLQQLAVKTKEEIIELHKAKVHPNPSASNTTIKLEGILKEGLKVEVYNQLGQLCLLKNMEQNQTVIDEQQLKAGYYFFKIKQDQNTLTYGVFVRK